METSIFISSRLETMQMAKAEPTFQILLRFVPLKNTLVVGLHTTFTEFSTE